MPRFTILTHDVPFLHWDFLLERGDTLLAWRLLTELIFETEKLVIQAERLPDHRLKYLDYEGTISGNRGTVTIWGQGSYSICEWSADEKSVQLKGNPLSGKLTIIEESDSECCLFLFEQDVH